tara:strand:- start:303 stop:485 length:183 start_codon:yes stop_codon:yes gene_type:complete
MPVTLLFLKMNRSLQIEREESGQLGNLGVLAEELLPHTNQESFIGDVIIVICIDYPIILL